MKFKGKMLVRRQETREGKPVLILCGVFMPDVDINEFDDRDEMWGVELEVVESVRMVNSKNIPIGSPEDFLENRDNCQSPKSWERKIAYQR